MELIDLCSKSAKLGDMSKNPYPYYEQDPPGANVRMFREAREWTQVELAKRAILPNGKPISSFGISRIENNQAFTKASLEAIARALGRPLTDLLTPLHLLMAQEIKRISAAPGGVREPMRKVISLIAENQQEKSSPED